MPRMNALYNCKNPYQGDAKKVLCVCSAGLLRSPTLANVLHREFGYNTRACGIHDYALIQYDDVLGHWADEIVVVSEELTIGMNFPEDKLLILDILDKYEYMNIELQKLCLDQYNALT